MASFGSGFAQGLQSGSQFAREWRQSRIEDAERDQFQDILKQQPTQTGADMTPDQSQTAKDAASAGDPVGGLMQPQGYTFMGQQFDHAPTPAELQAARVGAMANVLGAQGDWKGMMGLQLNQAQLKAAGQQAQESDLRIGDMQRQNKIQSQVDAVNAKWMPAFSDPNQMISNLVDRYNSNHGPYGQNGHGDQVVAAVPGKDGGVTVNVYKRGDMTTPIQTHELTGAQVQQEGFRQYLMEKAAAGDPQATKEAGEFGIKQSEIAATAAHNAAMERVAQQQANTQEGYRRDQADYQHQMLPIERLRAQAAMAAASNRGMYTPSFSQAGTLSDGTPVMFNQHEGGLYDATTNKPLTPDQAKDYKAYQKVSGSKPVSAGLMPVQGNPGLFVDGQGNYSQFDGSGSFKPVQTPQSVATIANVMKQNLAGANGQQPAPAPQPQGGLSQPQPAAPAPAPTFSQSPLTAGAAARFNAAQQAQQAVALQLGRTSPQDPSYPQILSNFQQMNQQLDQARAALRGANGGLMGAQ